MHDWLTHLQTILSRGEAAVLVTVAAVRGSAPREPGARMIVTREHSYGTIGGGQLELRCIRIACQQLTSPVNTASQQQRFTLGADCGQCCGGVVDVWFEGVGANDRRWIDPAIAALGNNQAVQRVSLRRSETSVSRAVVAGGTLLSCSGDFAASQDYRSAALELTRKTVATRVDVMAVSDSTRIPVLVDRTAASVWSIAIFGAGHVGTACAEALQSWPATCRLFDTRAEQVVAARERALNVELANDPLAAMDELADGSDIAIMTHDHGLDLRLTEHALAAGRFGYVGLIGSRSKRRRFEKRLSSAGLTAEQIANLTCPIGISSISGKQPFEIAAALSVQLIERRQNTNQTCAADRLLSSDERRA